ncbi:MAG: DUF115 domain-containing protein [Spirochaetaceae bacterium]|jgi:hypothetical protein|nr:DUF115 domain-containing protein [Spirochaetaceae bacterium]
MTGENGFFWGNLSALRAGDPETAQAVESGAGEGSCYGELTSGKPTLRFADGRAVHSVYNPEREARTQADTLGNSSGGGCVLFAGMGNGLHIQAYLERFPRSRVFILEANPRSLAALFNQGDYTGLLANPQVTLCLPETLEKRIREGYLPAIHGGFTVFPLRTWNGYNSGIAEKLQDTIKRALDSVSRDYSVQSHFGKIWFRNILRNLLTASKQGAVSFPQGPVFPTEKMAVIVAAGPSLDDSWREIAEMRDSLYVIATDTALPLLAQRGIAADAFVSIDGQNISVNHLLSLPSGELAAGTLAVLDLCAHPAIAEAVLKAGAKTLFCGSAHPLSLLAAGYAERITGKPSFPYLETSSGTVTIAALDFARKAGFREIRLYGADFAYTGGKPYARGVWLDDYFFAEQTRLSPEESGFSALMLRTPLTARQGSGQPGQTEVKTSAVLQSYARGLEDFVFLTGGEADYSENGIDIRYNKGGNGIIPSGQAAFPFREFLGWYRKELEALTDRGGQYYPVRDSTVRITATLLPLAAWAGRAGLYSPGTDGLSDIMQLALNATARYTKGYHD